MNSEEYKRALLKLFPNGIAWQFEDNRNVPKLIGAWADEFEIVDGSVQSFLNEFFPDTTTAFLPDWERVAGLPDPCSGLASTIALRRKDLIARITAVGGQSRQYFIDLAAAAGYTITITEFFPFRVNINAVGDPLTGENWRFAWQVNGVDNEVDYFQVGENAVGDPLATWGEGRLECLMRRLKPAHTIVIFNYS